MLCFVLAGLEGFDAQIIGFVAPAIIASFHAARQAMSGVFAAGLVGLLLGSLVIAPMADWFGRKPVLVGSALVFGAMSLATAQASSLDSLLWLRFLTGVGLGGALPNGLALTAEYLPTARRAALTMAMFVGFSVGAMIGGVLAASLVAQLGWQVVFEIGGVLPMLFAILLTALLPESIRYLAARTAKRDQLERILCRIDPAARFPPGARFVLSEAKATGLPLANLFREGRAVGTLLLWPFFHEPTRPVLHLELAADGS